MSRKLRVEIQRLETEKADEEAKIQLQQKRIWSPILYKRLKSGIRIEDLKAKHYEEALKMIKEYYVAEEVLCRNTNLKDDKESLDAYLKLAQYYLKDLTSLVAIKEIINEENADEVEEEIAGILVMKVMRKSDYDRAFNRNLIIEGEALKTCRNFTNYLDRKADIYKELNCDSFLQYLQVCVKPEFRHQGLGYQLMLCGVHEARSLKCAAIMGIFSCFKLQRLAKRIGMQVILEIYYREWKDKMRDLIFDDPGIGNYTCAVMACLTPSEQKK